MSSKAGGPAPSEEGSSDLRQGSGVALRPVGPLWNHFVLDPVALPLGKFIADRTPLRPLHLTLLAFLLSLISAGLFLTGEYRLVVLGAVVFQLSTLGDAVDGMVARLRPGSGSVLALTADHALDPVRVIINVLALAYGQYSAAPPNPWLLIWAGAFLGVHFMDWTLPHTIAKVRGAYRTMYKPSLGRFDGLLFRLEKQLGRRGLKVAFFSAHEREVAVLLVAPLAGLLGPVLIATTALGGAFYLLRLRFDVALVKRQLLQGTHEYLGDVEHPWEANQPKTAAAAVQDD